MSEGLRVLPAFYEADRRKKLGVPTDCDKCKQSTSAVTRQTMGCPYEPEPDANIRAFVRTWADCGVEIQPATDDAPAFPSVCAGYTVHLPEVVEAHIARIHWEKGELTQFANGQASTELLNAIVIHNSAVNAVQLWSVENPPKKGQ